MFDQYKDYQQEERTRRQEERELKRRGVWDPRFNPRRQASSLPPWVS
jgi:hypothetical protein